MTPDGTTDRYRRPLKSRIAQGDISLGEIVQVRSASGSERSGPGPETDASPDLPFLGPFTDLELPVAKPGGGEETRVLRVWSGYVMVITQNCEISWANDRDSRITVCPIVSKEQWPEGPWSHLATTPPPGYFYLPGLTESEAALVGLPHPWPESVAVLASPTVTTDRVVGNRRLLSLHPSRLPDLQDSVARFYATRGFANLSALDSVVGKSVLKAVETNQVVHGPSRVIKVYFGDGQSAAAEDELTVSYWGVRPNQVK